MIYNDIKRTRKWIWEGGENAPDWKDVEPVLENQKRIQEFDSNTLDIKEIEVIDVDDQTQKADENKENDNNQIQLEF